MTSNPAPALATPMPARVLYRAPGMASRTLSLAHADIAELDPRRTGAVELFGMTFTVVSA